MAGLERQRQLLDFALSSLARRPMKNLASLTVYTAVVFLLSSVMLMSHAIRREAAALLAGAPELVVQRLVAGRHDLIPTDRLATIRAVRGVAAAGGRLWGYLFDPAVAANYTFLVPPDRSIAAGTAIIGSSVAAVRGVGPGDVMSFRGYDGRPVAFTVTSTIAAESALVAADLFLVSEGDFRRLFGIPADRFTDIVVTIRNPREVRTVAEKIDAALPDARIILRDEMRRTYESVFDWREGMVLVLLVGAILAFAIFSWEKASGLSADERREIGILKAVGWETADVIGVKMLEGLVMSLTAFLAGYGLAFLHVFHFGARLFEPVLKGWSVLYPEFPLAPSVDEIQMASLFFFTVFPYTLATIVPIWRAAVVDPDMVMR